MKSTQLLIDEPPLQVLPSLAVMVGDREAIFLQQLHYWLQKTDHVDEDGTPWIYNSYEGWQEQFPFWGIATVRRIIYRLETADLVSSTTQFNKWKADNTKWYTIIYVALADLHRRHDHFDQAT